MLTGNLGPKTDEKKTAAKKGLEGVNSALRRLIVHILERTVVSPGTLLLFACTSTRGFLVGFLFANVYVRGVSRFIQRRP